MCLKPAPLSWSSGNGARTQRLIRICCCQNSGAKWNGIALQATGVAAAIKTLMVTPDDFRNGATDGCASTNCSDFGCPSTRRRSWRDKRLSSSKSSQEPIFQCRAVAPSARLSRVALPTSSPCPAAAIMSGPSAVQGMARLPSQAGQGSSCKIPATAPAWYA